MIDSVIRADRLTRCFGRRAVVRDLNLNLPRGQVTALVGLNGAGKTTTIRIIMGLLRPTRGRCEVFGRSSDNMSPETRMRIGYMVEGQFLYPSMRVDQCARFQQAGFVRWDERLFSDIVGHFGIVGSSRIGSLSRGQRAGVVLALTLAPDPELLVLDDPAMGLDPVSRQALNETIIEFASNAQRTVLISSHLLDDIERIADRVMVLVDGRLKVDTTLADLHDRVTGYSAEFDEIDPEKLAAIPGLIDARRVGNRLQLAVADADQRTRAAIQRIDAVSIEPTELTFADAVMGYLSRQRRGASFLSHDRKGDAR